MYNGSKQFNISRNTKKGKPRRTTINNHMKTNQPRIVRQCELCGKSEFEHLKPKDFFEETPALVVKNYLGEEVVISMNIGMEPYNKGKYQDKLEDVMDSYMNSERQPALMQMTPFGPIPMMEDTNVEPLTICKTCFKGLVNMLSKYGKFDKVEVF